MVRPRVLSFMTQWGGGAPKSPSSSTPNSPSTAHIDSFKNDSSHGSPQYVNNNSSDRIGRAETPPHSPETNEQDKTVARVSSMVIPTQPTMAEFSQDTPPELQPIFSYLNSHSNKLYQEGYFLKLHDLDSRGRPSADRVWNECFAQLVGTVLSLWDAAQLDAAGEDGEVIPTFINLTDASIKMIESLPMNGAQAQSLQNVLSISTAANNRYLLHFNSLHSLTQWTAGIRLAMYEHATLQESYTGSIIAGKGKYLNNIKAVMERSRFPTEDWARVRFGAGTPWRRCWCVITPPGEKEYQKAQKSLKKRSAYDHSAPVVQGDIKFYETRKVTKKTKPIATITDAFSAYAIYPQAKPLIDQSTLVKVEGLITIHSNPPSTTEGFVFVMPEVHPAVTGFEMMLRWLIPVFDTFALYGRPSRLIADVLNTKSLMFAMPTQRRYGYLELIDVSGLIHTEGSQKWNEREWRQQMKNLTSKRMTSAAASSDRVGTGSTRRNASGSNLHLPPAASMSSSNLHATKSGVRFGTADYRSTPSSRSASPAPNVPRTDSAPAFGGIQNSPRHNRAASDATRDYRRGFEPSRLSFESRKESPASAAPPPPQHSVLVRQQYAAHEYEDDSEREGIPDRDPYAQGTNGYNTNSRIGTVAPQPQPFAPVQAPPAFAHKSSQQPPVRPNQMSEMRKSKAGLDQATLAQLADANRAGTFGESQQPQHQQNPQYQQHQPSQYLQLSSNQQEQQYPPQQQNGVAHGFGGTLQATQQSYGRGPPPGRNSPQPSARTLPTIPGTPAANTNMEQRGFDLPFMGRDRDLARDRSPGNAVYARGPTPGQQQDGNAYRAR